MIIIKITLFIEILDFLRQEYKVLGQNLLNSSGKSASDWIGKHTLKFNL